MTWAWLRGIRGFQATFQPNYLLHTTGKTFAIELGSLPGRDAGVGDAGAEHVAEVDLADHHHHRLERRESRVREHLLRLGVDEYDLVTLILRGNIEPWRNGSKI